MPNLHCARVDIMILTKEKKFYKNLIYLAVPMIVQNLITYSVSLADNLMIGSLGDNAVSGVYMAGQVQTVLQVLSAGIEAAILLISSQYWGKSDVQNIRRTVSVGMTFSMILGAVFTFVCALFPNAVIGIFTNDEQVIKSGVEYLSAVCASYVFFCITQALIAAMRSVESAKIGMTVSLCSLIIDITLNYMLIFGKAGFPEMGVRGAAIATLIARICETVIIFIYVKFADKKLCFKFREMLHPYIPILKDFVRYGTPLVAGQLVWGINLFANSIILGHLQSDVITGVSLANTVNSLMYVGMNGLAGAVGIIIGKTVGSGDLSKIKEYSRTVQILFLIFGVCTGLLFFIIRDPFISLYNITDGAVFYSRQFITVLCFTCIGTCYQCPCLLGLVKSGGDVSFVLKNDTAFVFGVVIPLGIITSLLGAPPWVVYLALKSDQILKCIPAFFKIRKYNWMKNLTR